MIKTIVGAVAISALTTGAAMADLTYTPLSYADLNGWEEDDHEVALTVFLRTCSDVNRREWQTVCDVAQTQPTAKDFFETLFQPVLIEDGEPMLFTGYFEPEIAGALERSETYAYPIYRVPPNLRNGQTYHSRREIEEDQILANQGLEIAWLADPVDLFFLQVQGSGRIVLPDGSRLRVGYGGKNGRNYSSVGKMLIQRGILSASDVSADEIRAWVRRNPIEGQELLWRNESYVFFREVNEVPADAGPLGAMDRSVTPLRSLAVDPSITILGAPVWMEKGGVEPMNRLMIAQDTGSAIKGAQRADIYFGTGTNAGFRAGAVKDGGRMVVLMPVEYALQKQAESGQ